jgi:hypothetical protein
VDLHLRPSRAACDATRPRRTRLTAHRGVAAVLACVLGATLLSIGGSASALNANRIGARDARGFPSFYMDQAGRALQVCDDASAFCQGVGPNALTPPDGEAFYWQALTPLKTPRGTLSVQMAVEAAFAGQRPIVFYRIRVRGHLSKRGNYILRYPFGDLRIRAISPAEQRNVNFTRDVPCSLTRGGVCAPRMDRWLKSAGRHKGYLGTRRRTTVTGGTKRNEVQLFARDNRKVIGVSKQFRIFGKVCGPACRRRNR